MRRDRTTPQHHPIRILFSALVLVLLALTPAMAQPPAPTTSNGAASAQTPGQTPAQTVDVRELRKLLSTLKNDKARNVLIGQIEALLAVQRVADKQADETLLGTLSDAIGHFGDEVMGGVASLGDVPRVAKAFAAELANPEIRAAWTRVSLQLIVVFAVGMACERIAILALARWRRRIKTRPGASPLARAPFAAARALVDLAPIAAFIAAAYAASLLFHHGGNVREAALLIIIAYGAVRLVLVFATMVFAPGDANLRLAPVDDETAEYLLIWMRRIANVTLFGWFATEAARLLGLPRGGHLLLLKIVGLAITAMATIFVFQNRQPVSQAMQRAARRFGPRMERLADRVADIWHILTAIYIGAIYVVWAMPVPGGAEYMLNATVLTVIILAVARTAAAVLRKAVNRGFAISREAKARFPLLEARANRYLPALHGLSRAVVGVLTLLALLQAWGIGSFAWVASDAGRRVVTSAISIVAVLIGALIVWELFSGAIERYLSSTDGNGYQIQRSARARTLLPLARNALFIVIVVMVTLIVLSELGINIAPLLAGAGIIGIAVGFGSQKLVQDVITGAFILFEDTIAVGDVVKLDTHGGTVEAISIRAIRLRDANGAIHTVPFSAVGTVINLTREFAYAVFDVGVAYREDTDRVAETLRQVGADLRSDPEFAPLIFDNLEVLGVDRFDASAVVVKARLKTDPQKQWAVAREFNRRMKKTFDAAGIEIPFPQTTVWMGEAAAPVSPAAAAGAAAATTATTG